MRITAWILTVGLLANLSSGCSTPRMGLTKKDPPTPPPEERVRYGFPWSKQDNSQVAAAPDPKKSAEMSAELAAKLAEGRAASAKPAANLVETLQRAAAAEAEGNLEGARAAYLDVVSKEPAHAEAHHRLGVIADMRRDARTADEHYAKALAANPRDADLLSDMGYSLYLRGRLEDAEVKLKDALQVNQYHRSAQTNLGLVYGKQGRYDDALAMFRQAGTESEAQRNMATLFPEGKPGSTASLASFEPGGTAASSGVTSATANSTAPPFPADEPTKTSQAEFEQAIQRMMQSRNTTPVATTSAANSGSALTPPVKEQSAIPPATHVATNSKNSSDVWYGALGNEAATTGQSSTQTQGTTATNPQSNPFTSLAPPSSSSNASGTGGMLTPAQWAAQMAIGTGPGSMFPRAPQQSSAPPQSTLGVGFPGASANPWNTPLPGTSQTQRQPPVQQAYAEVPFGAAPQPSQNINWSVERPLDTWGSNAPNPANNPTQTSNTQPLSPPSPWNDVPQQAVWSDFATPSTGSGNPATGNSSEFGQTAPAAYQTSSAANVPDWNGGAVRTANIGSAAYPGNAPASRGEMPVVTPLQPAGNFAQQPSTGSPAIANPWGAAVNSQPGAGGTGQAPATTIPNWPYAPARP